MGTAPVAQESAVRKYLDAHPALAADAIQTAADLTAAVNADALTALNAAIAANVPKITLPFGLGAAAHALIVKEMQSISDATLTATLTTANEQFSAYVQAGS